MRLFTTRAVGDQGDRSIRVTNFVMPNACAVGGFEGDLGPGGLTMLWDGADRQRASRPALGVHFSPQRQPRQGRFDKQYRAEKVEGTDRMWRSKHDNYSQDCA